MLIGVLLVGGSLLAYANTRNDTNRQGKMAVKENTVDKPTEDSITTSEAAAASQQGSYITLADYTKDPSKYADSKKVYFFHASWCYICQGIEKEIVADMSKIPGGVTMIKTDFDSAIELRQKYGVTTQYTFVQVDSSEKETAQWSATSLNDAISGIKS